MALTPENHSATIQHEAVLPSTAKHAKPTRLLIKADFNKLKEDQDRVASEKVEEEGSALSSGSGQEITSGRNSRSSTSAKHSQKTTKKDIEVLLCKFMKLMSGAKESCKNNDQSKKAMIWPKKMLPALERMLGNEDGASESEDPPLPFEDGDGENSLGASSPSRLMGGNRLDDNWDSTGGNTNFANLHHRKRRRKLHRMLKMLRAMASGRRVGGNWDDGLTGDYGRPRKGSASHRLLKKLLNGMLGGSDRKDVLREMLEEFVNANGVDRDGEEAHEALDELVGRKSLFQFNDMMQNPEQNLGLMSPFSPAEPMAMSQDQSQAGADGLIHAQMLANGALAPMANPEAIQQRPPPVDQAIGSRLPGQAQGRALLVNPDGMVPRPVVAGGRMFTGLNQAAADQNVLRQQQLANEQLRRIKAAEERGIVENLGDGEMSDSAQRDSGYFQSQEPRAEYQNAALEPSRVLSLRQPFRTAEEQASVITSLSRPEIEDRLQRQPTIRSTRSRFEGSDFYANHNGLTAALENDSLLRRVGAFRRGRVLKGRHGHSESHPRSSTKSRGPKGLSKIKTLK